MQAGTNKGFAFTAQKKNVENTQNSIVRQRAIAFRQHRIQNTDLRLTPTQRTMTKGPRTQRVVCIRLCHFCRVALKI